MPEMPEYSLLPTGGFCTNQKGQVIWETCRLLSDDRLLHGFTTRHGGISTGHQAGLNLDHKQDTNENVRQNHLILAAALGYDSRRMVSTHQIHSDIIRIAQDGDEGLHLLGPTPYECDALITNVKGRPLIAYSADCIPILLWAQDVGAIAAIHAGWRGTVADIAAKCVAKLSAVYHADPAYIKAAIGPGISACCFSTHDDVPDALRQAFGSQIDCCITPDAAYHGKFLVDIKQVNALRLQTAGLKPQNIAISPECTCCLPQKYWSHRYTKGKRGGQAAVIMLR
ncbi:MAG: peptidoglycan editing factor PgeF [Firmicutes bacterium]|nr:peptidoglycan editing factor PgeF [Bacillota bacterium]